MARPENKPDLDTEDADRPKAGDGTKTATIVRSLVWEKMAMSLTGAGAAAAARVSGGQKLLQQISKLRDSGAKEVPQKLVNEMKSVMHPADFKKFEQGGLSVSRAAQDLNRTVGRAERQAMVFKGEAAPLASMGKRINTPVRVKSRSVTPSEIKSIPAEEMARRGSRSNSTGAWPMSVEKPVSVSAKTQKSVPVSDKSPATRVFSTPQGPGSTTSSSSQTAALVPKSQQQAPGSAPRRAPPGVAPVFENRPPTAITPAVTQNARRSVNPAPVEAVAAPRRAPTGEASVAPVFADRPPTAIVPSVTARPQAPAQVSAPVQAPISPSAQAGQAAGMQMATQTRPGGMLAASTAGANPTMNMAAVGVPQSMSPERAQQLIAADPGYSATAARQAQAAQAATQAQAAAQAAPRPMTAGRMALVAGSTGLAGAMMNRAPPQQQQQQVY